MTVLEHPGLGFEQEPLGHARVRNAIAPTTDSRSNLRENP